MDINIKNVDKEELLAALHNGSKTQGFLAGVETPEMSVAEAIEPTDRRDMGKKKSGNTNFSKASANSYSQAIQLGGERNGPLGMGIRDFLMRDDISEQDILDFCEDASQTPLGLMSYLSDADYSIPGSTSELLNNMSSNSLDKGRVAIKKGFEGTKGESK